MPVSAEALTDSRFIAAIAVNAIPDARILLHAAMRILLFHGHFEARALPQDDVPGSVSRGSRT